MNDENKKIGGYVAKTSINERDYCVNEHELSDECGVVFCMTYISTGKKYIGTTGKRLRDAIDKTYSNCVGRQSSSDIGLIIRNEPMSNFSVEILFKSKSKIELAEKKIEYIKALNTYEPNGFNSKRGALVHKSVIAMKKIFQEEEI